jgi:prepilin-type N-terminal cleavage/methylation domain-containing protein
VRTVNLKSENGFTLVELMVTMVVGSIVLVMGLALITTSERASGRVRDRVDSTQRARVSMEQVTQRLRAMTCVPPTDGTANPIRPVVTATPDQITFYADLDNDTSYDAMQWRLTAVRDASGALTGIREERWAGVASPVPAGAAPTRRRLLAHGISAATSAAGQPLPLFRYYAYPSLEAADPVEIGAGSGVVAADLPRVVRVDVAYRAQPTSSGSQAAQNTTLETSVYARSVLRGTSLPTFDCTG